MAYIIVESVFASSRSLIHLAMAIPPRQTRPNQTTIRNEMDSSLAMVDIASIAAFESIVG